MEKERIIVAGAGVFGLTGALELAARGYSVEVLEAGQIPNPLAGGTDISKVCRMEYGEDEPYMEWMERAREGWLEWNAAWQRAGERALYHETGVLMVSLEPMAPGSFEYESFRLLEKRGHTPERLGGEELERRFPAWSPRFVDGFFHAKGGWAESGSVVEALARRAREAGIGVRDHSPVASLSARGERATGVVLADGPELEADRVVLAAGSWTADLLPELRPSLARTYHPVWHLVPERPERFEPERFPVFTADVAETGFYGFPIHPERRIVKIAHHGTAVEAPADGSLTVSDEMTARFRAFLERRMPALAGAEIVYTRLCPYCDTQDEHFWIANDPERPGLTIASGGSGHGLKFAPVLGAAIADAVEGREHPLLERFGWRPGLELDQGLEAARCHSIGELG